jgi:hypothetical protein
MASCYHGNMMDEPFTNYSAFDNPAAYRICVRGKLDAIWAERLDGLSVNWRSNDKGALITVLEGELSDQAALAGVLRTLYDLHLSLLSIENLSAD